jgi:hypothetical protein
MKSRQVALRGRTAALLSLLLSAGAWTTATPYQPVAHNNPAGGGYSDQQVEDNRFRVTFSGNSMTSRQTVETYLLYRAAQLTTERGFDWFEMADRNTEKNSNTYIDQPLVLDPSVIGGRAGATRLAASPGEAGILTGAIRSGIDPST